MRRKIFSTGIFYINQFFPMIGAFKCYSGFFGFLENKPQTFN